MVRLSGPDALRLRVPRTEQTAEFDRAVVSAPAKVTRLIALDAFRGAVILLMLLVNNTAVDTATPPQLMHAGWNLGLHLADLVFPWFLFCVGVAIPFSAGSFFEKGQSGFRYLGKVVTRSVCLVGLGMFIDCATNKRLELSMGILQLIGIAYLIGALIYQGPTWFRPLAAALLLGGYAWAIMNVTFPGGAPGVFEENRNLIHYMDTAYLMKFNMDGLLAAIPAAGLILYGSIIGDVLRNRTWKQPAKFAVVALSGWAFLLAGDLLSVFVAYSKPVCTPSYLMVAGGTGAIALACFYLVADVLKLRSVMVPLVILGANAIAAYVFPILFKVLVLNVWVVSTPKGNLSLQQASMNWLKLNYGLINGGWAYTATYIGVWWIVLAILYRKRMFLRI